MSKAVELRGEAGSEAVSPVLATDGADARVGGADATENGLFWLFMAALAWVPWPLGSNGLEAWGINAILFPSLAMAYEMSRLISGRPHPVALGAIAAPALLFALATAWIVVQAVTFTPAALHSPLWGLAQDALGGAPAGSISIDRDLTVQALVRLLTAASAFWLALQFGRDARRADHLIIGIAIICVAYAAYGLVVFGITLSNPAAPEVRRGGAFVSATFFNRNNFATYAGLGAVILMGLVMRLYRRSAETGLPARLRLAALLETTGRGGAIHICGLFIIIVALLLSGSRGGILSAAFGGFVLLALTSAQRRKAAAAHWEIIILVAVAVVVIFIGFGDTLLGKIGQQGLGDESRLAIYRLTFGSILDSPLLGYGYGTFADVFPMFRDRSVDTGGIWLMAHNTYLEVFQGLGLLFGAMLVASVGLIVLRCFLGAKQRKLNATLPAIAASAACLIAVNALVDFSLQIQAVTLTFMAVLGAGAAQSTSSQRALHD